MFPANTRPSKVLTDNRNYQDLRMHVRQHLLLPELMGKSHPSKTLRPVVYGDARERPDNVVLVLKEPTSDA